MRGGQAAACALAAIALLTGACAKRVAPPVPEGEDYVFPAIAPGEVTAAESKALREAWKDVLGGDSASAVRRYLAHFLSDRRVVEIPAFVWMHALVTGWTAW